MQNLSLTVCRLSIAAWVGAAVLFVVVGISEVDAFDSATTERLVLIRFPFYYACGFILVPVSLASGIGARKHPSLSSRQAGVFLGLVLLALLMMAADYLWVYRPLVEMITPPGVKAKPAAFVTLHEASKWINMADVTLSLLAAVIICRPRSETPG